MRGEGIVYISRKERWFENGLGICLKKDYYRSEEPQHLHEFIEIVYIIKGSGTHYINGMEYAVERGSVLFINYRQTHYFKTDTEMELWNILLDPGWISDKLVNIENAFELLFLSSFEQFQEEIDTGRAMIQFHGSERRQVENLIQEMYDEYSKRDVGYDTMLRAQINILLTHIFRKMSYGGIGKEGVVLDEKFLDYIRNRSSERMTLESLAKECFYNPSYFSRLFREHYGVTVINFINQSRLEKAKDMLKNTNLSIEEISVAAGFSSRKTFYKLLKQKDNCTPYEYREKWKNSKNDEK